MPETPAANAPSPNRGLLIVLAYLWILAIIPLLVEKNDREVQWHAKHGLVLMVVELLLGILIFLLTSAVSFATLGLGCVLALFAVFAWVGVLALHAIAMIKGLGGGRLIVPGISSYADRF